MSQGSGRYAFQHRFDGGQINHALTVVGQAFVILAQATIVAQPGEGPFDHPAFGLDLETLLSLIPFDHLQHRIQGFPDPIHQTTPIGAIGPDFLNGAKGVQYLLDDQLAPGDVRHIGRADHHIEHIAYRVGQDMAFVAFDLLAPIKAYFAGFFGRFDTLTIDQGPCWSLLATSFETIHLTQGRIDRFQDTLSGPLGKMVVHTGPDRILVGQSTPLTAGGIQIEDAIDDRL